MSGSMSELAQRNDFAKVHGPELHPELLPLERLHLFIELDKKDNKMVINVRKTEARFNYDNDSYNTLGRRRGKALIINNVEFKDSPFRQGAHHDSSNLYQLFTKLNIAAERKLNLACATMHEELEKFAMSREWEDVDVCFVVIMSHGTGMVDTVTKIAGVDESFITVPDIINHFIDIRCPMLKDKPKIFIFQTCRGNNIREAYDSLPFYDENVYKDILIAYASQPGYVALRNMDAGSYYIQSLCKVIQDHACDMHIVEMLNIAKRMLLRLSQLHQESCYKELKFKKCYLHPMPK